MRSLWIRRLVCVLGLMALTAACTGDSDSDEPETTDGDARIVEHQYGETAIEGTPERVVSLGLTDADPLLALGVKPIAIRPGYSVDGVGPWSKDELGDATPEILDPDQIDVDQITALKPDLIVAISAAVDRKTYEQLSDIAPTIVRPKGAIDYGVSWEVATTMVGDALGLPDEATSIIEDTKVAISDTLRANPRIDGTTGEAVRVDPDGGWYVYSPVDSRGQFLTELGVNLPPALAKQDQPNRYWIGVDRPRTNDLEADVLLAIGSPKEQKEFADSPVFQRLAVNQRDGVVQVPEQPIGQALAYTTVLSIPYALDKLAPQLSEALD